MKIPEISLQKCFERLAGGAVLVTATRRLARHLATRYAADRIARKDAAWPTADILPYGAWLERLFYAFADTGKAAAGKSIPPVLMDDLQERLVWERIISESDAGAGLLDPYETARMVQEAWRLCGEWNVPIGGGNQWSAPDPAAFARWASVFDRFCKDSGFMDRARLASRLAEKIGRHGCPGCPELILAGFDEIAPARRDLFNAFSGAGVAVRFVGLPEKSSRVRLWIGQDDAGEIRAAARWAAKRIQADPGARIGIVSPRLAAERETVRRVLEDEFHPSAIFSGLPPDPPAFHVSAPPALCAYPLIGAAEAILDLAGRKGADVFEWSRLLRSCFLGGAQSEYAARAVLDTELREHGDLFFSFSGMAAMIGRTADRSPDGLSVPVFVKILEKLRQRAQGLPERQAPERWAETFCDLLEAAGWPGERALSSREYQVVSAFHESLEAFARAGEVTGPLAYAQARRILSRRLSETPFQPEAPETGVQVMGMLEPAGEEFDALWVMGMHHELWPPPARPNPFLPVSVQRERELPHCSPARELAYARRITARLLASAGEVICSFGATDGESRRLISPLLDPVPQGAAPETGDGTDYWRQVQESGRLEEIRDKTGAGLSPGTDVAGGTGIMKSQAVCPFQAYGRYRLGARALQTPVPGLGYRQRGILVHRVMELLWNRIGSHRALSEMSGQELGDRIAGAVDTAVRSLATGMPDTFTGRFTRVETERLCRLAAEWMEAERGRAPFVVMETESRMRLGIGGIFLTASADRIDRLDDGRFVIIDYKTGDPSPAHWFASRIEEPQLPLYSLGLGRNRPAGVFFARVRKGGAVYLGIAETAGIVPGVKPVMDESRITGNFGSMEAVIAYWQEKLESLAAEIRAGHAAVDPVSESRTCRFCDLSPLCRVWEISKTDMEPENDFHDSGD